mgnify:CR=1 FL=1
MAGSESRHRRTSQAWWSVDSEQTTGAGYRFRSCEDEGARCGVGNGEDDQQDERTAREREERRVRYGCAPDEVVGKRHGEEAEWD